MLIELIKFIICSILIVIISKHILSRALRSLAIGIKLKPKTIGNLAGIATSIPELLSVMIAGVNGLVETTTFNILTSNIINFVEYIVTVVINKNIKELKHKAIKREILLVLITIGISVIIALYEGKIGILGIVIFIFLFLLFHYIDRRIHKKYLKKEDEIFKNEVLETEDGKQNKEKIYKYVLIIICSGILLFLVGNILSNSLELLCNRFGISQIIIGILLGIITSAPEVVTFYEAQRYYDKKGYGKILGVIEATNNLVSSNIINLFIIQSIGMIIAK